MLATAERSLLSGTAVVPASKSHTIRAVILAGLAGGRSIIDRPLDSFDTRSAAHAVRAFGAKVETDGDAWTVEGVCGRPATPDDVIDVGNSGTTLYMAMGSASLVRGWTVITGDAQIRRRTADPLARALGGLGAEVISTRGNGMAPLLVRGPLRGGETTVRGITSQYVSSLLMACPLAENDSAVTVTELNESPYVRMTLDWLEFLDVTVEAAEDFSRLEIPGGQSWRGFERRIPGDFSTATFLICAGVLAGGEVRLEGLDLNDSQGDKAVIGILRDMGADITMEDGVLVCRKSELTGMDIDMNAIPDAIPMLSVCACFARGTTTLGNVPQARLKETDRIAVMAAELAKLGAKVRELPDGLEIEGGGLRGGGVCGHGDHRVVMAMMVGGCAADGPVTVDTAESAGVTFPGFWDTLECMGARIARRED